MKCSVCQHVEAMDECRFCADCGKALEYLLEHYELEELPGVCGRLGGMQAYLQRQVHYLLPSTIIAAVLVLEEKGRIREV